MASADRLVNESGIVAFLVSLLLAGFYVLLRLGFGTVATDLAGVISLSLFLIAFPLGWSAVISRRNGYAGWVQSPALGILVALFLSVLVSETNLSPPLNSALLAIAGVAAAAVSARWRGAEKGKRVGRVVVVAALFTLWIAGVVWGTGFLNPIFAENLALHGGTKHIDTLFHLSVANMVHVYGSPSVGIDGPVPFHYHYGSHWLFGNWAHMLGMSVLRFYQLGYAVVVAPLFIFSFSALVASVRRKWPQAGQDETASYSFYVFVAFLMAAVGFLPASAMTGVGVWPTGPLLSESYALALLLSFAVVGVALDCWGPPENKRILSSKFASVTSRLLVLIAAPLLIAFIGFVKISSGAILVGMAFFFVLRLRRLHRPLFYLALALCVISFVLTYISVSPREEGSIALFVFLRGYLARDWWPLFFPLHFFWAWVYLIARFAISGIRSIPDVRQALKQRRIVDVEAIVVLAVAGALPGMLLDIGSDAFYFSDVQRWFALAALLGCLPVLARIGARWKRYRSGGLFSIEPVKLAGLLVAVPILLNVSFTILHYDAELLRSNLASRREVQDLAGTTPKVALRVAAKNAVIRRLRGQFDSSGQALGAQLSSLFGGDEIRKGMARAPAGQVVAVLAALDRLPESVRRQSALFIPQDYEEFWQLLPDKTLCKYAPFVGPALSGMTLIDGEPPFGCPLSPTYGEMVYHNRAAPQAEADKSIRALCARARGMGLSRIYAIRQEPDSTVMAEEVSCLRTIAHSPQLKTPVL